MDTRTATIARGWDVVGSDGEKIGEVKDVREDHVVVEGGMIFKHDLYIPLDHIQHKGSNSLQLSIPADDVDAEGWQYPPNAGFDHEAPAYPDVPDTTMIQTAGYSAGRLSAPEPQGAVLDDGMIEPGEVPNEDFPTDETPASAEDVSRT
jgi:hypothetical protein